MRQSMRPNAGFWLMVLVSLSVAIIPPPPVVTFSPLAGIQPAAIPAVGPMVPMKRSPARPGFTRAGIQRVI